MRGLSLFVVVGLSGLLACHKADDLASAAKPPPLKKVKVTTAAGTLMPTPNVLTLTGLVAADQRSDVTADTQGKVINVLIQRGDHVKMGQPVIQLDVRAAALGAREAQAQLGAARAQKELAEQECARTKSLLDKGAITKSEYDRQMTQCTSALEQVSGAEARAQMMAKSVADGLVRAPFEGTVAEKMVSPGEWVAPGKPLFTLVDDNPLKIELSVPETAIKDIQLGQRVDIRAIARPKQTFRAQITRTAGEIGKNRALIAEATLDPTNGQLVPGEFAEASIVIGEQPHVVVPASAVIDCGKNPRVLVIHYAPGWVIHKKELEERIVQVGYPPAPDKATIVDGVKPGEQVVVGARDVRCAKQDQLAAGTATTAGSSADEQQLVDGAPVED